MFWEAFSGYHFKEGGEIRVSLKVVSWIRMVKRKLMSFLKVRHQDMII